MTDPNQTRLSPLRRFIADANDMTLIGLLLIFLGGLLFTCILGVFVADRWNVRPSIGTEQVEVPPAPVDAGGQQPAAAAQPTQPAMSVSAVADTTTVILDTGTQATGIQIAPPTLLQIDNQSLSIYPETIRGADLLNGITYDQVRWVQNTIVNYVLQVPATAENQQLVSRVTVGDSLQLITNVGESKEYLVTAVTQSTLTANVLAQTEPAITLIIAGESPVVIYGEYTLAPSPEDITAGSPLIEIGQTAALGNASLTVRTTVQVPDSAAVPTGYLAYEVEYQITNNGTDPLDTGWVTLALADRSGNLYGNQQIATNATILQSGQTALQTALYQLPRTLSAQTLTLQATRIDTPDRLDVALPYTELAGQADVVTLQEAQLSADGTTLLLIGEISNLTTETIVIQQTDLLLTDQFEQTTYLILETDPPFPWLVEPGNTQAFFLRTQRPDTSEAILRIQRQAFSLQNLR